MEIRDMTLTGGVWRNIRNNYLDTFFETQWDIFMLAAAIGILYDRQATAGELGEDKKPDGQAPINVGRGMLSQNHSKISYLFQTAILTSNCTNFSNKDRLYLAFSEDISQDDLEPGELEELTEGISKDALEFDKLQFLVRFANYGAIKLDEQIAKTPRETMENLSTFLTDSYLKITPELMEKYKTDDLMEEE